MKYRQSTLYSMFDWGNHLFLTAITLIALGPIVYIAVISFASSSEVDRGAIIPRSFTLDAYRTVLATPMLTRGYGISVFVTAVGTSISLFATTSMAYALSKKDFPGRRALLLLIVVTMFVSGGLIPLYLVVRDLHLLDSIWSLIIPSAVSAYYVILMKNFFLTIPDELEDAARLDGCSDFGVFIRIVLPLSKAAVAAFALFYAVGYWNTYFSAVIFINDPEKMPLQVVLRQLFILEHLPEHDVVKLSQLPHHQTLRAAAVILTVIPVLFIYPWIQRYFTEGVLLGSVKE